MAILMVFKAILLFAIFWSVSTLEIQRIPSTGSPPTKRQLSSMVHDPIDNCLYIYGGLDESGDSFDEMWLFNLTSYTWEKVHSPSVITPGRRFSSYLHYLTTQREILLYGGNTPKGAVSDLWMFDLVTRMVRSTQWTQIHTQGVRPIPSMHPYITSYTDQLKIHIAVIAGLSRFGMLDKFYSLDLETYTWSEMPTTGPHPRFCKLGTISTQDGVFFVYEPVKIESSEMLLYKLDLKDLVWKILDVKSNQPRSVVDNLSFGYNSYMYVMQGVDQDNCKTKESIFRIKMEGNEVETVYMEEDNQVSSRSATGRCIVGSSVYIFGGSTCEGLLNELITVDLCNIYLAQDNLQFEILSRNMVMPEARMEHAMDIYNDQLYIFGGKGKNDILLNDMWTFDLNTENWSQVQVSSHSPEPRSNFAYAKNGSMMFIFGGQDESGLRNDVYSFKFDTLMWQDIKINPSSPKPSARKGACMSALDQIIFIYGGYTASGYSNELWVFDPRSGEFELLNAAGYLPPPLINSSCNAISIEGEDIIFRVYLGSKWGSSPLSAIYEFNYNTREWTKLYNKGYQVFSRNKAATLLMGNDLLIAGGENWGYAVKKSVYHYNIASDTTTLLGTLPTGVYSAAKAYHKSSLYLYGGGSTSVDIMMKEPVSNLFVLKLNQNCISNKCDWPCSKGTYLHNEECINCDRGSYSDNLGLSTCQQCAPGSYSSIYSAESKNQCLLCPEGTYNSKSGQPYCLECSTTSTCLIGTSAPDPFPHKCQIDGYHYNQPDMQKDLNYEVTPVVGYVGISLAVSFILIVCILAALGRLVRYIKLLDIYVHHHNYKVNSQMYVKKTIVGGIFSIIFLILSAVILTDGIATYTLNNISEIKNLVPLVTLEEDYEHVIYIQFQAEEISFEYCFKSYGGQCEYKEGYTEHLKITQQNVNGIIKDIHMTRHTSDCLVTFKCLECEILQSSRILLTLSESLSYANNILVNVTSTSSIPNEFSSVTSQLSADKDAVFRGSKPSSISLHMTPSLYKSNTRYLTTERTGYHITNNQEPIEGSMASIAEIPYSKGLSVEIILLKDISVLVAEITEKDTLFNSSVTLMSYVFGSMGAIGFFLRLFERQIFRIYEYIKRKLQFKRNLWAFYNLRNQIHVKTASKMGENHDENTFNVVIDPRMISLTSLNYEGLRFKKNTRGLSRGSTSNQLGDSSPTRSRFMISRSTRVVPDVLH